MSEGTAVEVKAARETARSGGLRSLLLRLVPFPVFLAGLLVAAAFVSTRKPAFDPDVWWHAVIGQEILRTGHWPTHDVFSFTAPGAPWIAYEWFGELWMGLAYRWGERGLLVLNGLWAATMLVLLYVYLNLVVRNCKAAAAAAAVLLPLLSGVFSGRPQMLGYCFLLVELICLELFARGQRRALWVLPPLYLFWVNTHGSFILGLALLGAFWFTGLFGFRYGDLETRRWTPAESRALLLAALGAVAVLPLTPYGTRLAAYPFEMALLQKVNLANIQEWMAIDFAGWWGRVFLVCLLGLFIAQLLWRPRYRLFDLLFFTAAAFAAGQHIRFIFVFGFIVAMRFATVLARWLPPYQPEKDRPVLNVALLGIFAVGLIVTWPTQAQIERDLAHSYPVQALACIRQGCAPEPMLNEYGWGGYLIGKFRGGVKVFIDGRADFYEYAGVLQDYVSLMELHADTPLLLAKYRVRSAFIRTDSALATYLSAVPGWKLRYSDPLASVFVFTGEYPEPKATPPGR